MCFGCIFDGEQEERDKKPLGESRLSGIMNRKYLERIKHAFMTETVDPSAEKIFNKTVTINASTSNVWKALTDPALMKKWMFETELQIVTDWKVGGPIV